MTTRTVVVADSDPGGYDAHYTSLSAAEAGEQGDLVTLTRTLIIECEALSGDDTTAVVIDGWTCSSPYNITIRAASGHEHGGVPGAGYKLTTSAFTSFSAYDDYSEIYDIEIESTATSAETLVFRYGQTLTVERCIISSPSATSLRRTVSTTKDGATGGDGLTLRNCLILTGKNNVITVRTTNAVIDNCTAIIQSPNSFAYYETVSSDIICRNCIAFGGSTNGFSGTFAAASDYNATDDTSSPGANSVDNITSAAFTNYAGGDYTPATSGVLDSAGTNLSANFTDDITGATRTQWDIGAFGITGGGGGSTVSPFGLQSLGSQFGAVAAARLNGVMQK